MDMATFNPVSPSADFAYEGNRTVGKASPKVRFTLDITPELNARLDEIARQNGVTKANVLRSAIVLYDVASQAKAQNKSKVILRDADGTEREVIGL